MKKLDFKRQLFSFLFKLLTQKLIDFSLTMVFFPRFNKKIPEQKNFWREKKIFKGGNLFSRKYTPLSDSLCNTSLFYLILVSAQFPLHLKFLNSKIDSEIFRQIQFSNL